MLFAEIDHTTFSPWQFPWAPCLRGEAVLCEFSVSSANLCVNAHRNYRVKGGLLCESPYGRKFAELIQLLLLV